MVRLATLILDAAGLVLVAAGAGVGLAVVHPALGLAGAGAVILGGSQLAARMNGKSGGTR